MRLLFFSCLSAVLFLGGCRKSLQYEEGFLNAISKRGAGPKKAFPLTSHFSSEVGTSWFNLLAKMTQTKPYIPPQTTRIMAYAGLTLYESVVGGMPSYQSMYTHLTGNQTTTENKKDYYWPAVANAAMSRISQRITGAYGPNPQLASILELEANYNSKFLSSISQEQLNSAASFGQQVAETIFTWSNADGTFNTDGTPAACAPYTPLGTPGAWEPVPPGFFPAAGVCQGSLRTFIPNVVTQTLAPDPPAYSTDPSSAFYSAANEIYLISQHLTPDDINVVQAWHDIPAVNYNTPAHLVKLTTDIMQKEDADLEFSSVIYAKETMAMFDAIACAFYGKFHYSLLRPVTYIQGVLGHSDWNSVYPAPQHPAYPSTAVAAVAAAVAIANQSSCYGRSYTFIDSTQNALYGSWTYHSFDELLNDVKRSRTHGGINFRFANNAAEIQGKKVGEMINQLPFQK